MKKTIVFSFCMLLSQLFLGQTHSWNTSNKRIGGISFNEQRVLDKANVGVLYQFTQSAVKDNESVFIKDTLLLAIGNNYSIFLDPYYKENLEQSRLQRKSRSRKATRVHIETDDQKMDEKIELVNQMSDYKEENNGYPVQIYKQKSNNEITSVFNAYVENIQYSQQIKEMQQWNIVNAVDTLLGYPCQKATNQYAGRKYTAWFTMDIPLSDGPWKFYGLPGLILKVEDDTQTFSFVAIGIEQYRDNVEIAKDIAEYDTSNLSDFNKFIEKQILQKMVSFYNNGELYMIFKKSALKLTPVEKN